MARAVGILDNAQKEMIRLYRAGESKTSAYKAAHPDWNQRIKESAINQTAANAFNADAVKKEIARLDDLEQKAKEKAAMKDAEECRKLWSRSDSVKRLVDIADDCQKERKQALEDGKPLPDKVARLERDTVDSINKMLGYNEPEEVKTDTKITVEFADDLGDD